MKEQDFIQKIIVQNILVKMEWKRDGMKSMGISTISI